MAITESDHVYLQRCVALAEQALDAGHEPFGSILVDDEDNVLREEINQVGSGDATQHPEFALARWAAQNLDAQTRANATVYTSGEHCPMCSAAHAWVGLGRIVYASSMAQLVTWLDTFGAGKPPIEPLAIHDVAPAIPTDGPDETLSANVQALHRRLHRGSD